MLPDFPNCTPELIKVFHKSIKDLLEKEDSLPNGTQKDYGIREYPDWKMCSGASEKIMTQREIHYNPNKW